MKPQQQLARDLADSTRDDRRRFRSIIDDEAGLGNRYPYNPRAATDDQCRDLGQFLKLAQAGQG